MAKLYFSYAAMNAGKSTILLQASYNYQERGMRTLLLTSSLHLTTENGWITSRIGVHASADLYDPDDDLYALVRRTHRKTRIDCVFVDEAQFLTPEQVWQLARVADRLDVPVMCFGLRTDFQGKLFPGSAELLAIADTLREVRTICHCGRKATMVVRKGPDGAVVTAGDQIGIEKAMYVSLCRRHWEEEMGRWPAVTPARSRAPRSQETRPKKAAATHPRTQARPARPAAKRR
ncbi:MAG: thymidine kinase [Alphaproteobacteria bacterium]|nr:thymidine kinase [Alphaproteobacteria bacterium]